MINSNPISLEEARTRTLSQVKPRNPVTISIEFAGGLVLARDYIAQVDCPAASSSLKDGFAVVSTDVDRAGEGSSVRLELCGAMAAGAQTLCRIESGQAVKVMTGARLPHGATAVLACEYARETEGWVECLRDAPPDRNVLRQGYDVTRGHIVGRSGERLTPARTGLLAAAGLGKVSVYGRPRVGLIGIGDELVRPGQALAEGQLYASNLVTLRSWLQQYGMQAEMRLVPDQTNALRNIVERSLSDNDILLTSGGAWMSDRDLTVRTLQEMGGDVIFRRIRMGPGKGVALLMLRNKAVFCLPGGPPSNEMAFLQVALPGLLHKMGLPPQPFYLQTARLTEAIDGDVNWTQFLQARLVEQDGTWLISPLKQGSRIQSQADRNALIEIPEGVQQLNSGALVESQVLFPPCMYPGQESSGFC